LLHSVRNCQYDNFAALEKSSSSLNLLNSKVPK
jgi:hypothetical protein